MIGQKIRNLRESKHWTIRELAERATITHTMVTRYENGKANPSRRILRRISDAFEIPFSELIDEKEPSQVTIKISDKEWEEMRKSFATLNPEEQSAIKLLFDSVVDRREMKNKLIEIASK